LYDFQQALALDPSTPTDGNGVSLFGDTRVALVLGHSTALSGRYVSPLNPRVIVIGTNSFMAFQRGVQRLELIVRSRDQNSLNFYLLEFVQACNQRAEGCQPGDLFTPRLERDWLAVRLRDDEDLKNTPFDCRQCHQRARSEPTLLMRELNNPWTHFFEPVPESDVSGDPDVKGRDLMRDYLDAKGDEPYAGLAVQTVDSAAPSLLENVVGTNQPVFFDAPGIENERWPYSGGSYASEPQTSRIWEDAYEAFKRGEQLALPYVEPRVSDRDKQAALSAEYARYRAQEIDADELPDMADIFPDDPRIRARIGLQTEPDATPVEALIQACGGCHNDVLDQQISRARFNIDLSRLEASELARAIERIELPSDEPGVMPPREARQLEPSVRASLLEYLRQPEAQQPDPRLAYAAEKGMAGGARQLR
jgi:hypothetical protein